MKPTNEMADVLIVGAGASGGVAAKHLAEAGYKVVVLEQGNWVDRSELPGNKPEFALLSAKQWHPDPNVRGKKDDYPVDNSESDVPMWMYGGVGGSSILYAACWSRALPSDFRVRTLDGVADDWPISYEELEPFYNLMDVEMGVSGLAGNPTYPAGYNPPLPPFPINKTGRKAAEGMNKLGWHWWPGYDSIPSNAPHHSQAQCVRYGICRMGCPSGAKGSTDVTHFPAAMRAGAKVISGARVAQVTTNERGLADGAVYIKDGQEYFQPASLVILSSNAIGTARLLLMSASNRHPDGLGNSSGLVGKRLMVHPYATSVGIYEEQLDDWVGPSQYIESMQFYETEASRGFVRGCKWLLMPSDSPLQTVSRWTTGEGVRDEEFWGDQFAVKMRQAVGHLLEWAVVPEDLPEETNYVSLSPDLKDSDGLPAPKIHYRTSENTHKMLDFNLARTLEAHQAAGAVRTWVTERNRTSGHIMGTAKMGNDPENSVVDKYCRSHDVPNLFVIDGSVFPTSTGVNITATICANAKRVVTYISDNHTNLEVAR
ncbi:GMC family oxidoreductase [Dactylosporangium sp. CA-139114]|uniref:GMC family oxidoreductase n=1 Tax=Dactylosporangium sp. CA-139114 TaxID=3239931 RepID=UPI003D99E7DB